MANIFSSLFKQTKTEKPQEDIHPPTAPIEFSQYDSEFISYCIERVETLGKLESEIHAIDDPQDTVMQVLRTACAFHAADWTGILYVDVELGITSTGWWHNPDPQIKTLQVISEFENFFPMESWQKAIKTKQPVVVTDLSIIAKDSPQEYLVYKRLGVKTMIALPFGPKPLGFLVIRNPTRYNSFTGAGIGFAYICHSALVQKRMLDRAKMALTPEEIKSDKDIIINFFGDLEIITQNGIWKEQNFNSPKSTRAVVFVMLQGKRAHSPLTIADALYPEDSADTDTINKNIRGYIYRFRKSFELISKHRLIEYTSNGYKLNSTLNIKTDIHQFETIWEQVQQDIPMTHKVHLLKRAIKLYKGAVFQTASDDHWLVGIATEFKMKYISMVNELLSILVSYEDFDGVHHFALKSLKLVPENVKAQYWLVYAMYHSGAVEIAKREIGQAKLRLTEDEYATLKKYIIKDCSLHDCLLFDE